MGLNKYKLGQLIERVDRRNINLAYDIDDVRGVSIEKKFIATKADMEGVSLSPYSIIESNAFAYVTVTSRNGEKISIAYNNSAKSYICSSSYVVFRISENKNLNPDYLYMYFNRPEFDRYSRFNSWGSAREVFSWDDMCDMTIALPPLSIQQKYVDVYNAMLANQKAYESGLEDLKLTCDAYIERLRQELPHVAIGGYIGLCEENNTTLDYEIDAVKGVSIEKRFIPTKADMEDVSLKPYLIVEPEAFAYVTVTSRNGEKISIAHNSSHDSYICSSSYAVFRVSKKETLIPSYLKIFFNRPEFDRYARFHSWGSARETFSWEDICEVKIPIPDIDIQQAIVDIYNAYIKRQEINEKLKAQIKDICPILIKGSLDEARGIKNADLQR